ncbi:MAG: SDR family oxidoreductase [Magnetococcus sp. DMHC-6]
MKLAGTTALITGGRRRIGAECAKRLASHRVAVAIHSQRANPEVEELCNQIRKKGGSAEPIYCDLAKPNKVIEMFQKTRNLLGPVHILINNAAIFETGLLQDTSLDHWNRHLVINCTSPFLLMQAMAQQMELQLHKNESNLPWGKIINLLDRRILRPQPGHLAYTAAKTALWAVTQMAAKELAPVMTVNAIGPGPILPAKGSETLAFQNIVAATPMGRAGSPAEIADAMIFLLEHDYITGEMLCVDGGEHL